MESLPRGAYTLVAKRGKWACSATSGGEVRKSEQSEGRELEEVVDGGLLPGVRDIFSEGTTFEQDFKELRM